MAEAVALPAVFSRHHFLLRRLHSLTGIIPVGVFLINHLLTNSTAFLGTEKFDDHVAFLHSIPYLLIVEVGFIFLPLAFHGLYGIVIALEGKSNAVQYPWGDNWRYTLQRWTAWITLGFVVLHLAHYRFAHWFGWASYMEAGPAYYDFTRLGYTGMWLPMWLWMVIYLVGVTAAVYHFCNGIATFCITWGITVGDISRKRVSYGAAALGVVLMIWGVVSLFALGPGYQMPEKAPHGTTAIVQPGDVAP